MSFAFSLSIKPLAIFHKFNLTPFSAHKSKAQVGYCHIAPSVVHPPARPSVNFSHFQILLQSRLMDFDET